MVSHKIILTFTLITFVHSFPLETDVEVQNFEERNLPTNNLLQQLDVILKRNIESAIGSKPVEVGDKFTGPGNDGHLQISIQKFSYDTNLFPVTFKPNDDTLIDDDTKIKEIKGDFDDTAVYKIETEDSKEHDSSEESKSSEKSSTAASSTTKPAETTSLKSTQEVNKDTTILKEVAAQPILTTV